MPAMQETARALAEKERAEPFDGPGPDCDEDHSRSPADLLLSETLSSRRALFIISSVEGLPP